MCFKIWGKKKKEELRKKRDELAMRYYNKHYGNLCSIRQRSIDNLIETEKQKSAP